MATEIILFRNGSQKIESGFAPEEIPSLLQEKTNILWIDMDMPDEAETNRILSEIFRFHPLSIEDALLTRNQPKIEIFSEYLFFIVHGVKPGETSSTNFVTKELDGFLGENFLVTFHFEKFRSIENVKRQLIATPFAIQRGPDYLFHQILDNIVDLYLPIVDEFDSAINKMEDRIFKTKSTGDKILEEIMDIKRSVARLRRISSKQLEVLYKFSHNEVPQIKEVNVPFFRDVHDHLMRVSDLSESYRDLVAGLMDLHFAVISNKTNEITKVLAIFSAIILPLSLIAGIYGMNFQHMPELQTRYGYFIVLGLMVLIGAMLLAYFWKKGWIGEKDLELPDESEETTDMRD